MSMGSSDELLALAVSLLVAAVVPAALLLLVARQRKQKKQKKREAASNSAATTKKPSAAAPEKPDIGTIFGLDCGGSLAKLVYFERTDASIGGDTASMERRGGGGGTDESLRGRFKGGSDDLRAPPASTLKRVQSLAALDKSPPCRKALDAFYSFMAAQEVSSRGGGGGGSSSNSRGASKPNTVHEEGLSFECNVLGGRLHFLHFETRDIERILQLIRLSIPSTFKNRMTMLGCTGGGSIK